MKCFCVTVRCFCEKNRLLHAIIFLFQEGAAAQKASDDTSTLGQASLKYLDALALDESKSVYNFHVGRSLVIKGEYNAAVKRLEAALGWNQKNQMAKYVQ